MFYIAENDLSTLNVYKVNLMAKKRQFFID